MMYTSLLRVGFPGMSRSFLGGIQTWLHVPSSSSSPPTHSKFNDHECRGFSHPDSIARAMASSTSSRSIPAEGEYKTHASPSSLRRQPRRNNSPAACSDWRSGRSIRRVREARGGNCRSRGDRRQRGHLISRQRTVELHFSKS